MVVEIVIKTIKVKTGQQVKDFNNDGNMDLGTNGFTSDVSLPKDKANKTQAIVNKL